MSRHSGVLLIPPIADHWLPWERALLDDFAVALGTHQRAAGKYEWIAASELGYVIRLRPSGSVEVCRRARRYYLHVGTGEIVTYTLVAALAAAWVHCCGTGRKDAC